MKNLCLSLVAIIWPFLANSQDSTSTLNHEIGVNAVGLIKQLVSNNPSQTLGQLPYTVFYNLYYKNTVGLRLGFGGNVSNISTNINGQAQPRTSNQTLLNYRAGVTYNFLKQQRITFNVFLDGVGGSSKISSANTSTSVGFPGTTITTTIKTESSSSVSGVQTGLGVNYTVYKNFSIYTEIPFVFSQQKNKSLTETTIIGSNLTFVRDETSGTSNGFQIFIPATLYFVLKF